MSFGTSLEALGNKRLAPALDVPNAPDPHSENTSAEMNPGLSKLAPPHQAISAIVASLFRLLWRKRQGTGHRLRAYRDIKWQSEWSKACRDTACIVLDPKRVHQGQSKATKRGATLPASLASGAVAATCTSRYPGMS